METVKFQVREDGSCWEGDVYGPLKMFPIILLHGGGQTRHSWSSTASRLWQLGYSVVALDMKGHGGSYWDPDADYSSESFADDLVTILQSPLLKGLNPILVGASLGGITSVIAQYKSGLAAGVVMVDITPSMQRTGVDRIVGFMLKDADTGFASMDDAIEAIRAYTPNRKREKNLESIKKNLRFRDGRYYWHWDPRFLRARVMEQHSFEEYVRNLWQYTEKLEGILLIRGQSSDLVSEEGAQEFLQRIKGSKFVDVSNAAHMVVGDNNDIFSNALISYLEELTSKFNHLASKL